MSCPARAGARERRKEGTAAAGGHRDRDIDFLGRYLFDIKARGPGQGPRPLRDPDAAQEDEPEEG
ncbi:hypothetical protein ACGFZH_07655 [Streptomyces zaomyceticus]|uniref:hypothetical protein n=1 Tax=Streptomyces zaomyceticus TaxID=68286 RepID=UPI00372108CD